MSTVSGHTENDYNDSQVLLMHFYRKPFQSSRR